MVPDLLPWLAQFLSYTTRHHKTRDGTTQNGLGLLTAIINSENTCTHWLTGQSEEGNSSTEDPLSPVALVCVQLTKLTSILTAIFMWPRGKKMDFKNTLVSSFTEKVAVSMAT